MNILENLYVVESSTDLLILKLGLFISLIFALSFLALLLGSTIFSVVHFSKAKSNNDNSILAYSKFTSGLVTKMWFRMLFGVLPMFASIFFFTQLYADRIPTASGNLLLAFILFMLGLCSAVFYKTLFSSEDVKEITNTFPAKIAWVSIGFLLLAAFILVSYLQLTVANGEGSFFAILFSSNSLLYFMLFISLSFGLTAAVVVAKLNRNAEKSFTEYGRYFSAQTGMIFSFLHPLLFTIIILSVPLSGLSFLYFGIASVVLLLMLISSIQFYYSFKSSETRSTSIVFVFVLLLSFLVYSVQLSSETSSKKEMIQKGELELFS